VSDDRRDPVRPPELAQAALGSGRPGHSRYERPARLVFALTLLYVFLVGVGLLEGGIRQFGAGFEAQLLESVGNPLAGLFAGIAATVIVQSSSISTATIVGLVGSGTLPVSLAVPMIMGANIGTTITNTLASLGSIRRLTEFRRAFAAATMHDFFNIIAVALIFPLELATGVLSRAATGLAGVLMRAGVGGAETDSPIRTAVKAGTGAVERLLELLARPGVGLGVVMVLFGIALLFTSLRFVTTNMRAVMAGRIEQAMNRLLDRGGGLPGIVMGVVITIVVMSSSITTSILVPMVAAGVLTVRNAYPVTLGANIGTTFTALLAALAIDQEVALVIALVHTIFNVVAILLLYPVPAIRDVPVRLAEWLAEAATRNRSLVAAYVVGLFVAVPVIGLLLLG
jgi:solute carrier family 34 (sodium-dependent phosphate cotransporter)